MLFNSYAFLLFFAVVLLLHNAPLSWRVRKLILLAASYLFYAAWNPPFVILLLISTLIDWIAARGIASARSSGRRRAWLIVSLSANLGILGYFKYGGFFLQNFLSAATALGFDVHLAVPSIILPIGISFYTFQTMSYTIDIYRGQSKPSRSFLDYALYVTFFPQLVAGPIVRAGEFLHQCVEPKRTTAKNLAWGMMLFVGGLFQKMVVADLFMSSVVEQVFGSKIAPSFLSAWTGTLAFAVQILCDFAGYSSCAIGIAMTLGFSLPTNFRFPYAAIGFSDFWRRWHISLSTWLRDCLYISLGGNRQGRLRTHINLMLTMLLGGLWHGASWRFVVWGGLHGIYLVLERELSRRSIGRWIVWHRPVGRVLLGALTFFLVCLTWPFFRADSFSFAWAIVTSMLLPQRGFELNGLAVNDVLTVFGITGCVLAVHGFMRSRTVESAIAGVRWWVLGMALSFMLYAILCSFAGEDRAFIYFQF